MLGTQAGPDVVKQLQCLSLASQACSQLDSQVGPFNKALAEFIMDLPLHSPSCRALDPRLQGYGAHTPSGSVQPFLDTIHEEMQLVEDEGVEEIDHCHREGAQWAMDRDPGLRGFREMGRAHHKGLSSQGFDGGCLSHGWGERWRRAGDLSKEPESSPAYRGGISRIMDNGSFVNLFGFDNCQEGIVHVSRIEPGWITNVEDAIRRDQEAWVKLASIPGQRLMLSMKDTNQNTEEDPTQMKSGSIVDDGDDQDDPIRANTSSSIWVASTQKDLLGMTIVGDGDDNDPWRSFQRRSSHGLWEATQLISSGVLDVCELPACDDEAIEGELERPAFIRGQTGYSIDVSSIKILKNSDGSLERAAMAQCVLAEERRELREQPHFMMIPNILNSTWEEPMAEMGERHLAQEIKDLGISACDLPQWKKDAFGKAPTYRHMSKFSIQEQRCNLPIFKLKDKLIQAIHDNQVLVITGETGAGKTTQLTQYLYEAGYTSNGKIGCRQPCRLAAMSVAKRVAEEFGCRMGEEVGCAIRFEDCTGPGTVIKYMTDAMLLREVLVDKNLVQYSVIVLDEAHERTIHTDVLFGLLKKLVKWKSNLRLIVTCAFLDAEKLSGYFCNCNIFTIAGSIFPVEIMYTKQPERDHLDAALNTVMHIHLTGAEGDILLFLTGQEEIPTSCQILYERMKELGSNVPQLIILPVDSSLPSEMLTGIFEPAPPGMRKVVVAASIPETSLTIDGICYVVDPGLARKNAYNPKTGLNSLVIAPISQALAKHRARHAGRTGPGRCYRLYTESAYRNEMLPTTMPEVQRIDFVHTILQLKAMGINHLLSFDFIDPPPPHALISAMEQLYSLEALDEEGLLTNLGRKMAEFPLDPAQSKMLFASVDLGCSDEILTIISMLQAQNIFYHPQGKQTQGDQKREKFFQPEGDHLTLLAIYETWRAKNFSDPWCHENFIQLRSLRKAQDVRKQLLVIMDRLKLDVVSAGKDFTKIRKAICAGFFFHASRKDPRGGYCMIVENQTVFMHRSSALFKWQPDWVIYHELVIAAKKHMREVTMIDPKWLVELAPRFFKVANPTKISKRKRRERLKLLYDHYHEPNSWPFTKRRG